MLEQSGRRGWLAALALVAGAVVTATVPVPTALATSSEPGGIPNFACGAARVPGALERGGGHEPARLQALRQALQDGRFHAGSGVRVHCAGTPPGRSYPITWQLRLEQLERVETLGGERSLSAFEERYAVHDPHGDRRVAGTLVAETVLLPEAHRWHVGADGTTLHARRDTRRGGASCAGTASGRCSLAVGMDWHLGGSERQPELSLVRYVNGVASGAVLWRLQR